MSEDQVSLDRPSVVAALADYILQVNYRGYRPDLRKVLSVRRSDRTAWLRNAGTPIRWEVWYYIEGELFPEPGATRLAEGQTSRQLAEELAESIWDRLWIWNGFDFTPTSSGLNRGTYSDQVPPGTPDEDAIARSGSRP
ncbi:hypothetical protein EYW49_16040 [Siculibacillus lacustris]|uniref:Uncharacterized protein n=1 Tax=Siculibacillus lacustris TaxID=1549641 RepID=A0A4V2KT36_9HYPH|nr:hypothetical protein [Siculibacillus lacustris]TBW35533.1 hypothetical protein EYW49_16040 [Siculibacillus lacustris]